MITSKQKVKKYCIVCGKPLWFSNNCHSKKTRRPKWCWTCKRDCARIRYNLIVNYNLKKLPVNLQNRVVKALIKNNAPFSKLPSLLG